MIKLYTREKCPRCRIVKKWLYARGLDVMEIDIDKCPQARAKLQQLNATTVPVTEINGHYAFGFDTRGLEELLTWLDN